MKNYPRLYAAARDRIYELEEQLSNQAIELASLGHATFEVRAEEAQQLADYAETNKRLIEFVEKIAGTKSKFASEARDLLQ